ncbi:DcaP family trimeric outer membrane transporter [uncultured Acinetobacter sp.]|uniref:DcaP family trimeric outer membrane transporter n=1 Tax=uncultured Acinetobacter sp. TaxID=165433 RepID=UPI002583C92E|nr:DcaP family trimeric outer membrane transporter [uncultured Acinetobacter sp.]
MERKIYRSKVNYLAAALMSLTCISVAHADTTAESIDALRQEVNLLKQELERIKAANEQPQSAVVAAQLGSVSTTQPERVSGLAKTNGGADLKVYGYIRADASYQNQGASTFYNNISAVPLENTEEAAKQRNQLRSSAAATRIGLDFSTPTALGELKGKFETDFFGGATRDQFRIRHAYLTLNNWLVGQTWSTFIAPEYLPETVEAATYVGGSLQRTPIVRYTHPLNTHTNLMFSLEDPKYTANTDPDHEMRTPAFVGRVNHKFDNGSVISGRGFVAEKKTSHDELMSWGVGLGGKLQLSPETLLKADYYHVKGDGRFLFWANSGYALDANQQMHQNEFDVITLGATHQFAPKIRSTLGYGYMKAKDDNTFANLKYADSTQNKDLWQGWINIMFDPVKPINLGLEYVYGERTTFDGRSGYDNRFNIMAIYNF